MGALTQFAMPPMSISDLLRAGGLPAAPDQSIAPIGGLPRLSSADIMGGQSQASDQMAVSPVSVASPNIPPSFFGSTGTGTYSGHLGTGRMIAGLIGDALLTGTGKKPMFSTAMAQQAELARKMQDSQIDRAYKMAQIQNLLHPQPSNDYDRIVSRFGQDAGDTYLRNAEAGPPMAIDQIDPVTHQTMRTYAYRNQLPGTAPQPSATPGSGGGGPAAGTIVDGYRFKGGDPNDQGNWESVIPTGGASLPGSPIFPDPMKAPGTMTSGRRTVAGNAAVGGVAHSHHLDGDAADYVGATPAQLAAYFGSGARILNEGNHVHVTLPGYGRVPYFGAHGTMGL